MKPFDDQLTFCGSALRPRVRHCGGGGGGAPAPSQTQSSDTNQIGVDGDNNVTVDDTTGSVTITNVDPAIARASLTMAENIARDFIASLEASGAGAQSAARDLGRAGLATASDLGAAALDTAAQLNTTAAELGSTALGTAQDVAEAGLSTSERVTAAGLAAARQIGEAAIDADISTLPLRRAIEASAKLGKPIAYTNPQTGQTQTFDFPGLGDAETSKENADKMAAAVFEIQKKYGPEFIQQANEQLKLAGPQGVAARESLYNEVMTALSKPVDSPVADSLEAQILAELQADADVDKDVMTEVDQYLTVRRMERGGSYGKADEFERAMNMGTVAENRRSARQQKGAACRTRLLQTNQ